MLHQNKGVNHKKRERERERRVLERKAQKRREEKVFPVYGKNKKTGQKLCNGTEK